MEAANHTDTDWADILNVHAVTLRLRCEARVTGPFDDLDLAIDMLHSILFPDEQTAVPAHRIEGALRARVLANLGDGLESRFCRGLALSDLDRAIEMVRMAITLTGGEEMERIYRVDKFQRRLMTRMEYNKTTSVADHPNQDTSAMTQTLQHRYQLSRLIRTYGNIYIDLIRETHDHVPLLLVDHAIRMTELIEAQTSPDLLRGIPAIRHVIHWSCLRASLLGTKFDRTQTEDYINAAINLQTNAKALCPPNSPLGGVLSRSLSGLHFVKFRHFRTHEDLELWTHHRSISLLYEYPTNSPLDSSRRLERLADCFLARFSITKSKQDADRAVGLAEMAYSEVPRSSPAALPIMETFARSLEERSSRFGGENSVTDATRAFEIFCDLMERTSTESPDYKRRIILFNWMLKQVVKTDASLEHANRAISLLTDGIDSVHARTDPSFHRSLQLLLSPWLRIRSEATRSTSDLTHAINILVEVITQAETEGEVPVAGYSDLANAYMQAWHRNPNPDSGFLDSAILSIAQAVKFTDWDSPHMSNRLSLLGCLLRDRWEIRRSPDDLERAIEAAESSIACWRHSRQGMVMAMCLANFALTLKRRASLRHSDFISDLDYAVELLEEALWAGGQSCRFRARMLNDLFDVIIESLFINKTALKSPSHEVLDLRVRKVQRVLPGLPRSTSSSNLERALSMSEEALELPIFPVSERLTLAKRVIEVHAENLRWNEADKHLHQVMDMLSKVSPRSLDHKEGIVARFAGLAASAVAICLEARKDGLDAIQCLERGRGIINGLQLEMRSDISSLKHEHPKLADEFASVRDQLEFSSQARNPESDSYNVEAERQAAQLRDADSIFNIKLAEIRALPGYQNFLAAPSLEDLYGAAKPDPIAIINMSAYRCDAILIRKSSVEVLNLPDLHLDDARSWVRQLSSLAKTHQFRDISPLLEWLWRAVCLPILDGLGFVEPVYGHRWPRIWWIPTGVLSRFPLHAAGYHAKRNGETVMDRVMSSYASSVRSLIYVRQHRTAATVTSELNQARGRALLVEMSDTPGHPRLPQAAEEIRVVETFCPLLGLEAVPLRASTDARKSQVLHHIRDCHLFHFAGHGSSHMADPSQSKLLLHGLEGENSLLLEDLRDHRFQENPPFLCYLSACSTGVNEVDALSDEGMHFISAFQMAGFRHVIGTLWSVSDEACLHLAEAFYGGLTKPGLTDQSVCEAFHKAVRELRDLQMKGLQGNEELAEVSGEKVVNADTKSGPEKVADEPRPTGTSDTRAKLKTISVLKEDGTGHEIVFSAVEDAATKNAPGASQQNHQGTSYWVPYVHYGA